MDHSSIAEILKIGLLLGYLKKEAIISWADDLINIGEIDEVVIEISLSRNKSVNDLLSALNALSNKSSKGIAKRFFLNFFMKKSELESHSLVDIEIKLLELYHLGILDFSEDEKFSLSILESDYSLRRDGYKNQIKIDDEINSLLFNYKDFDLSQFRETDRILLNHYFK